MSSISFYFEQCKRPPFLSINLTKRWIKRIVSMYKCDIGSLSYIFCKDDYLLDINRKYLQHDYYTDVITFDYREEDIISGDIFISLDTVYSNSLEYSSSYKEELSRIIIHGVLHLIGFNDKTEREEIIMRNEENRALEILKQIEDGKVAT